MLAKSFRFECGRSRGTNEHTFRMVYGSGSAVMSIELSGNVFAGASRAGEVGGGGGSTKPDETQR